MSLEKAWLAIKPFTYTLISCFVSYKLSVAMLNNFLPPGRMLDLGVYNWFFWIFNLLDLIWVVAVTNFYYFLGLLWFHDLPHNRSAMWGSFVGIYSAFWLIPFDLYFKLFKIGMDIMPNSPCNSTGFSTLLFYIPSIVILFVIFPLMFLWLITFLQGKMKLCKKV